MGAVLEQEAVFGSPHIHPREGCTAVYGKQLGAVFGSPHIHPREGCTAVYGKRLGAVFGSLHIHPELFEGICSIHPREGWRQLEWELCLNSKLCLAHPGVGRMRLLGPLVSLCAARAPRDSRISHCHRADTTTQFSFVVRGSRCANELLAREFFLWETTRLCTPSKTLACCCAQNRTLRFSISTSMKKHQRIIYVIM